MPDTKPRTQVVRHHLQSTSTWVADQAFSDMDSVHLQNALRLLIKPPVLAQLDASHYSWMWTASERDELFDEPLPNGGENIWAEWQSRRLWDYARKVAEGDIELGVEAMLGRFLSHHDALDYLSDHSEPLTLEQLEEKALVWIKMQPSFLLMRSELIERIINGTTHVQRPPTPLTDEPF